MDHFCRAGVGQFWRALKVWRDSKTNQAVFKCPATFGTPAWYPLGQEDIDIFDETEQMSVDTSFPFSPQPPPDGLRPFPAEAQRTGINGPDFPLPFDFGWIYLSLNTTVSGNPNPPFDPSAAQAWVSIAMDANGRFSVGFNTIQLDSACAPSHFVPVLHP